MCWWNHACTKSRDVRGTCSRVYAEGEFLPPSINTEIQIPQSFRLGYFSCKNQGLQVTFLLTSSSFKLLPNSRLAFSSESCAYACRVPYPDRTEAFSSARNARYLPSGKYPFVHFTGVSIRNTLAFRLGPVTLRLLTGVHTEIRLPLLFDEGCSPIPQSSL